VPLFHLDGTTCRQMGEILFCINSFLLLQAWGGATGHA
jgi:hypothetical protein